TVAVRPLRLLRPRLHRSARLLEATASGSTSAAELVVVGLVAGRERARRAVSSRLKRWTRGSRAAGADAHAWSPPFQRKLRSTGRSLPASKAEHKFDHLVEGANFGQSVVRDRDLEVTLQLERDIDEVQRVHFEVVHQAGLAFELVDRDP